MKPQSIVGVLLVAIGIIAFAYQGFTYTTREKAVDLGPIQITADKTHTVSIPPVVGAVALIAGLVLLATSGRKA
jgi:uncharacterized membrane protein